jgi:hypothetical protein
MSTSRHVLSRAGFVFVLAAALAAPTRATADFILVTSEPALGANDSVDWGGLGMLTTPNFKITSAGGTQVTGAITFGGPWFGYSSHFAITQVDGSPAVTAAAEAVGPPGIAVAATFTLDFSQPVFAAGANIITSGSTFGVPTYTEVIATDTSGNKQTFYIGGDVQEFLGVSSDTANLSRLEFYALGASNSNAASISLTMGKLELDSPTASAVPAPGGPTLAGIGIIGLVGYAWRRRKLAVA